jgi:hypothetical protein
MIEQVPALRPWLERLASYSAGEYTADSLARDIAADITGLWVVWDHDKNTIVGVAIVDVYLASSGVPTAIVRGIAWDDKRSSLEHVRDLEAWAERIGCKKIKLMVPKKVAGHLRAYDMTHVVLERALNVEAAPVLEVVTDAAA